MQSLSTAHHIPVTSIFSAIEPNTHRVRSFVHLWRHIPLHLVAALARHHLCCCCCAGLASNGALDAAVALSGPDGGMCAHEPPVFRLPAATANQPLLDSTNGYYVFDRAASSAHYIEAPSTFFIDLAHAGGFTAVVALRLRSSPSPSSIMTVLSLRGPNGVPRVEAQMGAVSGSQPSFSFTDASRNYVTTSVNLSTGTWIVLAFHYVHSTSEWSIYINGVQQGNNVQADVRPPTPIASSSTP